MTARLVGAMLALVLLGAAAPPPDHGTRPAAPAADLATRAAEKLRAALPGTEVKAVDAMTLGVNRPGKPKVQVNLDRVAAFCAQNAQRCDAMLSSFVARVTGMLAEMDKPPAAEQLRVVVRPGSFLESVKATIKDEKQGLPVREPFLDLDIVCELDAPTSMKPVMPADLAKLGLDAAAVLSRAKANMHAALSPLAAQTRALKAGEIGELVADGGYTSSRLIFPGDWSVLAARLGGGLIVAVPADNLVLYAKDDGAASVAKLKAAAKAQYARRERPISTSVYRWHKAGWEIAN